MECCSTLTSSSTFLSTLSYPYKGKQGRL
uniref:Uncharacterized protein n=1 Tax=Salix viminalis TaxID=40686 RepID=A0A6N2JYH6_SALVM